LSVLSLPTNNTITSINLANNSLTNLDVSNLISLQSLNTTNNPNLNGICVNNNQFNNQSNTWLKDNQTFYSVNCETLTNNKPISFILKPAYPNPTTNYVILNDFADGIYNISGQKVVDGGWNTSKIDFNLAKGLYFIKYFNGLSEKLIVQ
jgi:hypothetical protein